MIVAECSCGKRFNVGDELAGKRVRCTHCSQPLAVPSTRSNPPSMPSDSMRQRAAGNPSPDSSASEARCGCGVKFRVKPEMAGKMARCPRCKNVLQLPGRQEISKPSPMADPLGSSFAKVDDGFWDELKADFEPSSDTSVAENSKPALHQEFSSHQALSLAVAMASRGKSRSAIGRKLIARGVGRGEAGRILETVCDAKQARSGGINPAELFFSFNGRITAVQYLLAGVVLKVLDLLVSGAVKLGIQQLPDVFTLPVVQAILLPYILVTLVCSFAICIKRMHDMDRPGWYVAIGIFSIVGIIPLAFWLLLGRGTPGPNKYGPPP